jgi:serine/threonine-protein kinase
VGVALAGGSVYLPLIAAPATNGTHLLEVYTPGSTEPLVLFAAPLGAPTRAGFPVQLRMYDAKEVMSPRTAAKRTTSRREAPEPPPSRELRARVPTSVTLTERHTRDLDGELLEVEPEDLVGRTLARGKLVIDAVIGAGGVGSVYRASHRDLRIPVAVKVLHDQYQRDLEFCRRFHSEALAASRLDHPNLMRVVDFGQEPDGMLYLAMEHLDGTCLADVLRVGEPLPLSRIIHIMMQVAAGLAHAHSRGIIHRDIKPDNIMLVANKDDDERPDELVKVCDFGIAVQHDDSRVATAVAGTPHYMSPEQCRGEPLDGRSDVYSCGILLYELATGEMPFQAPTVAGIIKQQVHTPPPPPRGLVRDFDLRLEAVILKALAKEPERRQQSMRELRREIGALLVSASATPAPPPPSSPTSPQASEPVTGPEWLERGGSSYRHDSSREQANVNGHLLAGELVARPATWLSAFAASKTPREFEALAARLLSALPVLMAERQLKALFAVRCTLDELASQSAHDPGLRLAHTRSVQQAFGDPGFLASLAETSLSADRPPREVTELVLRLGTAMAYALYSARLKLSADSAVRRRFVLLVRDLGADGLPMLRAGLARLQPNRDRAVAADLAVDLLHASPHARDDEAGELTSLYLQGSPAELMRTAASALVGFWGPRATPFLLGLLGAPHPEVVVAAIDGLRELQVVDERVVAKIMHAARATTSSGIRAAARSALLDTSGSVRGVALRAAETL